MPLIFSGEIYGFWVFGIESNKIDSIPQFSTVIEEFGSQIAAMLYHRQQWMLRSQSEDQQYLQRYLQLTGGERTYPNLTKSLTLIKQRLGRLENILSHLNTATISYNLFGNVIHVNKGMIDLLQAAQLSLYSMNLLDIIVTLCDVSHGEAREFLRRIAFEKVHLSLPAIFPNNPDYYYILHLRPIIQNILESWDAPEEVQPFHITGILCELVDINDVKQMNKFKIQIVEKIHNEIQGDLKSFTNLFYKIEKDYQIPKTVQNVLTPMKKAIDNLIIILDNMYKILNINTHNYRKGIYPINLKEIIQSSIDTFEPEMKKNISINTLFLGENELAFASPTQLKYAIHTILDLLTNDAIDDSQITIEVQDDMEEIRCTFSNTGFGMPNASLQNYLYGSADVDSEAFIKLRQIINEVRRWAATLDATSEMGVGLRFCLQLKAFL
jgi:signal transduction histidine kinase